MIAVVAIIMIVMVVVVVLVVLLNRTGQDRTIPHICHGRHRRRPCKFFLAGVNFYRFNAKNWQFTV